MGSARRRITAVLLAVLGTSIVLAESAPPGRANVSLVPGELPAPSLSVSPTEGPTGTKVSVKGEAFVCDPAAPDVVVLFDDTQVAEFSAVGGGFSGDFSVPDRPAGLYKVVVRCTTRGTSLSQAFTVNDITLVDLLRQRHPGLAVLLNLALTIVGVVLLRRSRLLRVIIRESLAHPFRTVHLTVRNGHVEVRQR